jgi:paraquat-inducible protein B
VRAKVRRSGWLSPIWAIPIVTAAIAAFLVWHTWSQRGPTITVTFRGAEGLTAGQSQLRYRDVTLGTVTAITLADDLDHVTLSIQTTRAADPLLTENARFWVVKPRLFAGTLSGIDTLLSGSYVQIAPGAQGGQRRTRFTGLEDPPLIARNEPGSTFLVRAERLGSISLGSPVFFRDLTVGTVLGWDVADMAEYITIHAFIRAPYDRYVRQDSRFWNASGVSLTMGAEGVQLQLESLRALLLGGIAFETPPTVVQASAQVAANTLFQLYPTRELAANASAHRRVPMLSYFTDSVSGLAPGAPVVFRGVRVGQVLGYDLQFDRATETLRIPVRYELEPSRIAGTEHDPTPQQTLENARFLVRQGMRARLASANLLTGAQQISLDFVHDAPAAEITLQDGVIVFPSAPGQFAGIIDGVNQVLARIEALPLEAIGENLNATISELNTLLRGPEVRNSLASLQATLSETEALIRRVDAAATPALRGIPPLVANLNTAVTQANRLIASANRGYGDESQFRRDIDRMLEQITVAARSLRSLADTLNRNPESLIRGRSTQGP